MTELPEAGVTVIRPMMYVPEQGVAHFVADQGIRVVKNTCPVDGSTKRAYAKQLIEQINRETPGAKERIMHAIMNGRFLTGQCSNGKRLRKCIFTSLFRLSVLH